MNQCQENATGKYEILVTEISNNISMRLSDLISDLLNSSQDLLFDMSDDAENNTERSRYFELMIQVRRFKSVIANNFNNKINELLLPDGESKAMQPEHEAAYDELSLVDQNDMDRMIVVNDVGERTNLKFRDQLSHLEARLEYLKLKTHRIFKSDALAPINICHAFDAALADSFDSNNRKLLFGLFDSEIANKLDDLYDSINNRLIDADILPQIRSNYHAKKYPRSNSQPSYAADNGAQDQANHFTGMDAQGHAGVAGDITGPLSGQTGGRNISGFAMTAPPGGNYRQAYLEDANVGGISAADGVVNLNSVSQITAAGENEQQYQHYTAGIPANLVSRVLSNYIGASFAPDALTRPAIDNREFYPQSTASYFGNDEVIQALTTIQNQPQFTQQELLEIDAAKIKQALLEAIARTSGGVVTKRINERAEKTIDFIELIFNAINENREISDAIKTLLLKLQIPVIKASMSDQEFFIYDNHPARQILDKITRLGVGVENHNDDVYVYLDKIVNNILHEYDLNSGTFDKALDDLDSFIDEQESITSAREAEQQDKLLRKHARSIVLRSLRNITVGKVLPEAIHPIILKHWPTLMFNHYLANGRENDEWVELLTTLRQIVDCAQPIASAEHLARIISAKDTLFKQMKKYLGISSSARNHVQHLMAAYTEMVHQHIEETNFTDEEIIVAENTVADVEPDDDVPVDEIDLPTLPPDIMPGMWYKLYMGKNTPTECCKLSVILIEDANLMFVNHKGELVVEKSFDEFNDEIARSRTRLIMGNSAFEKAFNTVINRLN